MLFREIRDYVPMKGSISVIRGTSDALPVKTIITVYLFFFLSLENQIN